MYLSLQCYEWPPQVRDQVAVLQLLDRLKVLAGHFLGNGKFVGSSNQKDR